MRTTLTLDDRIDQQLRLMAVKQRISYREMVNRALKMGLEAQQKAGEVSAPFRVKPHRGGFRPGVDPEKLNQMVDDLDIEDFEQEAAS